MLLLLGAAFAVSLVVLSVGGAGADAGIALFAVGAAAALGLFALLARSKTQDRSSDDQSGSRAAASLGRVDG
jgi:membrane protein implicated in regulation of membrane protease activity